MFLRNSLSIWCMTLFVKISQEEHAIHQPKHIHPWLGTNSTVGLLTNWHFVTLITEKNLWWQIDLRLDLESTGTESCPKNKTGNSLPITWLQGKIRWQIAFNITDFVDVVHRDSVLLSYIIHESTSKFWVSWQRVQYISRLCAVIIAVIIWLWQKCLMHPQTILHNAMNFRHIYQNTAIWPRQWPQCYVSAML